MSQLVEAPDAIWNQQRMQNQKRSDLAFMPEVKNQVDFQFRSNLFGSEMKPDELVDDFLGP